MSKRKEFTRDEVEHKQDKAVQFLRDVVGNDDLADEIDDLSEVYSILRDSDLEAEAFLDRYYDDGSERTQRVGRSV